jgi:hypothetical protein
MSSIVIVYDVLRETFLILFLSVHSLNVKLPQIELTTRDNPTTGEKAWGAVETDGERRKAEKRDNPRKKAKERMEERTARIKEEDRTEKKQEKKVK